MGTDNLCQCRDDIEVIKNQLAVLRDLFVGNDLLVRGNIIVNGRITDSQGGFPKLGPEQGETGDPCTAQTLPKVFNLNDKNVTCTNVTQGEYILGESVVYIGSKTPSGQYTITNLSPIFDVRFIDLNKGKVIKVPPNSTNIITVANNGTEVVVTTV